MNNPFKVVLVLCSAAFISVGCSSTSDVVEEPPAQEPPPVVQEAPPPEPVAAAPVQVEPEPEPEPVLDTVFYFDFDEATLRPSVRNALQAHAERLKSNSQTITIEGHADERGPDNYNKELGKRRAEAVKDFLISMGVSEGQIQTVSYGEESPLSPGESEMAWQQNRRVEIK